MGSCMKTLVHLDEGTDVNLTSAKYYTFDLSKVKDK